MVSLSPSRQVPLWSIVVITLLVSAGTAAAISIVTINPNPITPGTGSVTGSSDLSLDQQQLEYSGVNVTGVDVVVNNTGGSSHTGNVHVALKDSSGNIVEEKEVSGESFPSGSTSTVSITLSNSYAVDEFDAIEVNVEETA